MLEIVTSRVNATGNNTTRTYSYTFKVFSADDLDVIVRDTDGVDTTLTKTTHYTVTGVGTSTGGTVVLVNGSFDWISGSGWLKTGYKLSIRRKLDLTQTTGITNQSTYYPSLHEQRFDKLTMMLQQHQDELDRSPRVPWGDTAPSLELPSAANRAGKFLGFDDSGSPVATGDLAPFETAAAAAAASASAAAGSASAASGSASAASASASAASDSEDAAAASAAAAADSEDAAADSETAAAASAVTATSAASGITRKNFWHNGAFDFWQRGTTLAAIAASTTGPDRLSYLKIATAAVHTVSRSTDVPTVGEAGYQAAYSALVECTTADASLTVDLVSLVHSIEGCDFAELFEKEVTLSFWVKSSKTGINCVRFAGGTQAYIVEYTINAADTWEKKTITLTLDPTGSIADNFKRGSYGLNVQFILMSSSIWHGSAGSWQAAGNLFSTSNQVNNCDSTSNTFRLALVKLEIGDTATPFTRAGNTIDEELRICQRFYEKSYDLDTAPGTVTDAGAISFYSAVSGSSKGISVPLKVPKRLWSSGRLTIYSPSTGTEARVFDVDAAGDITVSAYDGGGESAVSFLAGAYVAGNRYRYHYVFNAN